MNLEELQAIIARANTEIGNGNYDDAEILCNEALYLAQSADTKNFEMQELRACAMGLLAETHLWRDRAKVALPIAEAALEVALEAGSRIEEARSTRILGGIYRRISDYPHALEYMSRALALHEELGNSAAVGEAVSNIGILYASLSDYHKALEYMSRALAIHEQNGNAIAAATTTGNIGLVYSFLYDLPRALEYMNRALAVNEELGANEFAVNITGNIGNVYLAMDDYPRALEYYNKALARHLELGNRVNASLVMASIGLVYRHLADYSMALEYYGKALTGFNELGMEADRAHLTGNIGEVYAMKEFDGYNAIKAEAYLLKALETSQQLGVKHDVYEKHRALAQLYKQESQWKEAYEHFEKYHEIEHEVQNDEARKQAELLEHRRKVEEAERDRQVKIARFEEQEKLLHNVLPQMIADRLLGGERMIADHYDAVSILFIDLVNFTALAQSIPPKHLVHLLNNIFSIADKIMESNGLEKIKTIGDAYMAVAGAPLEQSDHATRAAKAAIELLDAVNDLHVEIPRELGSVSRGGSIGVIEVRIGLHCGAAVGGVIGDKKFTYDFWGDAVNIAARMEQYGEPGKIHCSEDFIRELRIRNDEAEMEEGNFQLIIRNSRLVISSRGEMEIKGKGLMQTYFLEKKP